MHWHCRLSSSQARDRCDCLVSSPQVNAPVGLTTSNLAWLRGHKEEERSNNSEEDTRRKCVAKTSLEVISFLPSKIPSLSFQLQSIGNSDHKNRARGNRKTIIRPKMMSEITFGNLKLKSLEEYLIYKTYFVKKKKTWFSS